MKTAFTTAAAAVGATVVAGAFAFLRAWLLMLVLGALADELDRPVFALGFFATLLATLAVTLLWPDTATSDVKR